MTENKRFSERKSTHLKRFDYSGNHRYFITICADKRKMIFGRITVGEGLAPPEMKLSVIGNAVKEQLLSIHNRYKNVTIENYVIMPNHLHMIMRLENPCDYSDSADKCSTQLDTSHDIICSFKSLATRSCRQIGFNNPVWQRSYFEHIIRNEDDYKECWEYIDNNPAKWVEDRYYSLSQVDSD